jgi:hypothetical protein
MSIRTPGCSSIPAGSRFFPVRCCRPLPAAYLSSAERHSGELSETGSRGASCQDRTLAMQTPRKGGLARLGSMRSMLAPGGGSARHGIAGDTKHAIVPLGCVRRADFTPRPHLDGLT